MSLTTQLRWDRNLKLPQLNHLECHKHSYIARIILLFHDLPKKVLTQTSAESNKQEWSRAKNNEWRITNALNGWHRLWRNFALQTIWYIRAFKATIHTLTGTTLLITFEWQISENTRQVYRNRVWNWFINVVGEREKKYLEIIQNSVIFVWRGNYNFDIENTFGKKKTALTFVLFVTHVCVIIQCTNKWVSWMIHFVVSGYILHKAQKW